MPVARINAAAAIMAGALFVCFTSVCPAAPPTTVRVSVSSAGVQANDSSTAPSINGQGAAVVFSSQASTLVPGDANGFEDVFLHDIPSGGTSLITSGANFPSYDPTFSAAGRFIAFASATGFNASDTNQKMDVYVYDTWSGAIQLASVATDGTLGNNFSVKPSISGDGRYVAFQSVASTLVPDDTNGKSDVFVRDMIAHTTTRVSVASDGTQATGDSDNACISINGNRVAFHSVASNLVTGDTNGTGDVFMRDLASNTTARVSVASDDTQGNGESGAYLMDGGFPSKISVSSDGNSVAFRSAASNLVPDDANGAWDIFVRDVGANTIARVSIATDGTQGNANSYSPSMSQDGGYIAFASAASNLVAGDTNGQGDVFERDTAAGTTVRLSVATDGSEANQASDMPSISGNARFVAFRSTASNLVTGDTNPFADIFVRGPLISPTISTGQATVNGLSATLGGVCNPTGAPATAWFDYGPTTEYGFSTNRIPTGAQNHSAAFFLTASGLSPATTYHYRAAIDDGYGPVYGGDASFVTGAPVWGTAVRFDGASEVRVRPGSSISAPFTIECWARPADVASPNVLLGSRAPYDASFDIQFAPTGIHGDIGNGSAWLTTHADAAIPLTAGAWYHIAYVVTSTGYTIYVNGEQKASGGFTGAPVLMDLLHNLVFGNYGPGRDSLFRGDMDEVRIWTTARTSQEILADYDHPLVSGSTGLALYYRFDDGTGGTAKSDGGANVPATFTGNPVWVPSTVPLPNHTILDVIAALRIAAGLDAATPEQALRYAADPAAPGVVDLPSALTLLYAATH